MDSWKDKELYLIKSIEMLSKIYGEDDSVWLKEYIDEVLKLNKDNMRAAQECCQGLLEYARMVRREQFDAVVGAERG